MEHTDPVGEKESPVRAVLIVLLAITSSPRRPESAPPPPPASTAPEVLLQTLEGSKNRAEAVALAERVAVEFEKRAPLWAELKRMATNLERLGLIDEACTYLVRFGPRCGARPDLDAQLLRARILLRAERYEEALRAAAQARYLARSLEGHAKAGDSRLLVCVLLANLHEQREEWDRAIACWREAAAAANGDHVHQLELDAIRCVFRSGDADGARDALLTMLRGRTIDPVIARRALRIYVRVASESGRLEMISALEDLPRHRRQELARPLAILEAVRARDARPLLEVMADRPVPDRYRWPDMELAAVALELMGELGEDLLGQRVAAGDMTAIGLVQASRRVSLLPVLTARLEIEPAGSVTYLALSKAIRELEHLAVLERLGELEGDQRRTR